MIRWPRTGHFGRRGAIITRSAGMFYQADDVVICHAAQQHALKNARPRDRQTCITTFPLCSPLPNNLNASETCSSL
jgi:hypothetical protein